MQSWRVSLSGHFITHVTARTTRRTSQRRRLRSHHPGHFYSTLWRTIGLFKFHTPHYLDTCSIHPRTLSGHSSGSESRWRPIDPFAASCCCNPCARVWLPLGRSLLVLTTLYWLRSQLSSTCISLGVRHPRFDPDALDSGTGHAC